MSEAVVRQALSLYRQALAHVFELLPGDAFSGGQTKIADPRAYLASLIVLGPSFGGLPDEEAAAHYAWLTPDWTQTTCDLGVAVARLAVESGQSDDVQAARFAVDMLNPDDDWQDYRTAYDLAFRFLLVHRDGGCVATDLELPPGHDPEIGPEDFEDGAESPEWGDGAPTCDQQGCDRPGVIEQAVITPEGRRDWHWCITHNPEAG